MKPFNLRLFGGAVAYNVLVIGVAEHSALKDWCYWPIRCISCCYEALL